MPRRNVDQEVLDLAAAHGLQELTDGADVPVVDERMRRLEDVPGRADELPEGRLRDGSTATIEARSSSQASSLGPATLISPSLWSISTRCSASSWRLDAAASSDS